MSPRVQETFVRPGPGVQSLPLIRVDSCDVGKGLFAAEPIPEGREILRFQGPEITLAEVRSKGPLAANALQVGVGRYLDLEAPGRLVNHSCEPNAGLREVTRLVAIRPIKAGEEIRFDYSTTIADGWTMHCRCLRPACRGIVSAFLLLPRSLRLRYSLLQLVPPYIDVELEN